jgi:hypothetical protein
VKRESVLQKKKEAEERQQQEQTAGDSGKAKSD